MFPTILDIKNTRKVQKHFFSQKKIGWPILMSRPPWNAEETITSKENKLSYKIRKIFKEPPSYRQNLPHDNVLSNCGTLSKISKSVIKSGLFFYMTVCKCHLKNCKNQISENDQMVLQQPVYCKENVFIAWIYPCIAAFCAHYEDY